MNRNSAGVRRRGGLVLLVAGTLALAGCGGGQGGTTTSTSAVSTNAAAPSASAEVRPECTAVADAARKVADQVALVVGGQGDRQQVALAADQLRAALAKARVVVQPEAQANIDAATAAVQQLQTAARAEPFSLPDLRAAAVQTLDAMGKVFSVCAPATTSAAPPPVPGY